MTELVRKAAPPLGQAQAIGLSLAESAIVQPVSAVALDTLSRAHTAPAEIARREDLWEALVRGWQGPVGGELLAEDLTARAEWRDQVGPVPEGEQPFLVVRFRWPGGEAAYGELDRPVGRGDDAMQIEARVLELGALTRAFGSSHGLSRSLVRIRLANGDRALDWLLRDPRESIFQVEVDLLIGFRTIPPRYYRPIGPGWIIGRVEGVDAESITLELRDVAEGRFGAVIPFPTVGDVRDALRGAVDGMLLDLFPEDTALWRARRRSWSASLWPHVDDWGVALRVPFGRELVPLQEIGQVVGGRIDPPAGAPSSAIGYAAAVAAYITGASRVPAMGPRADLIAEVDADPADAQQRLRIWSPKGGGEGFLEELRRRPSGGWIGAKHRLVPVVHEGREWYVGVLLVALIGTATKNTQPSKNTASRWLVDQFFPRVKYAQWARGAERDQHGTEWWRGRHDPAAVACEILHRYVTPRATAHVDHESMARASSSADRHWAATGLAGEITPGELAVDVLDAIGRSHELDFFLGSDGRLRVRPATITDDDLSWAIPAARRVDARWDIVRGSWQERVPLASERWGLVTSWRITGEKSDAIDYGVATIARQQREAWGRVLEGDADVTWWDRMQSVRAITDRARWRWKLERFAHIVTFRVGLQGLAWELGDYLRISHWAGVAADGGYQDRLVRIEGLTLHWRLRQVEVTAVDFGFVEEEGRTWPGVLDDERHWERLRRDLPDGETRILTAEDSQLLQLVGEAWEGTGLEAGDLLRMPAEDGYGEMVRRVVSVSEGGGAILVTVDEPMGLTREVQTMILERSHLHPPTDELWPGRYPVTSQPYIRLADEETGLFSDGRPGYLLQG